VYRAKASVSVLQLFALLLVVEAIWNSGLPGCAATVIIVDPFTTDIGSGQIGASHGPGAGGGVGGLGVGFGVGGVGGGGGNGWGVPPSLT
jgi:hypothetical protein